MKNLITKLIKISLGLLGVALVDSCIPKAEYGCPHADFEAKGVVTLKESEMTGTFKVKTTTTIKLSLPYMYTAVCHH